MKEITIIDYGMGNLRSVQKKIQSMGGIANISSDPNEIREARKLILPGVGHFAKGVENLKKRGIWDVLNEKVLENKTPILGICLGMQLMAKHSEEGNIEGLGWFDADVVKFKVKDKLKYKVPHMGWNTVIIKKESRLLMEITEHAMFYFVHSYHVVCYDNKDVLTTTDYEYEFISSIQKENIYGTQYHPEKSHEWGEKIFRNFIEI